MYFFKRKWQDFKNGTRSENFAYGEYTAACHRLASGRMLCAGYADNQAKRGRARTRARAPIAPASALHHAEQARRATVSTVACGSGATLFLGFASEGEFDCAGTKKEGAEAPSFWHPQRESNSQLPLRRGLLYPFNYAGVYLVLMRGLARVYSIAYAEEICKREFCRSLPPRSLGALIVS